MKKGWIAGTAAFAIYGALAVLLLLWPKQPDLRHAVLASQLTDTSVILWSLAWWPWAISHGINPLMTHVLWAPIGQNVVWCTTMPTLALLFWPITVRWGPIFSYNLIALLAPTLAAWSAYHKYRKHSGVALQFCLAHLIRDVKFLATLPEPATVAYGQRLLEGFRNMFHVIHQRRTMETAVFQKALEQARDDLVAAGLEAPEPKPAQNMAKRFRQNSDSYFRFITTPGLEPTNNLAEQALRFVVLDRHVTQGTRGERGRQWCQRIWSAIATCRKSGCFGHSSSSTASAP